MGKTLCLSSRLAAAEAFDLAANIKGDVVQVNNLICCAWYAEFRHPTLCIDGIDWVVGLPSPIHHCNLDGDRIADGQLVL